MALRLLAISDIRPDRQTACAASVTAMRDYFLEASCGCGARRVISLRLLARYPRLAHRTLAQVASKVSCKRCVSGPDEVHLTATHCGRERAGAGEVWSLPLIERGGGCAILCAQG